MAPCGSLGLLWIVVVLGSRSPLLYGLEGGSSRRKGRAVVLEKKPTSLRVDFLDLVLLSHAS